MNELNLFVLLLFWNGFCLQIKLNYCVHLNLDITGRHSSSSRTPRFRSGQFHQSKTGSNELLFSTNADFLLNTLV